MTRPSADRDLAPRSLIHFPRRSGSSLPLVIIGLLLLVGVGALAWYFLKRGTAEEAVRIVTATVTRGPFEHIVLEQGTVESSGSFEVRCEVRSSTQGGTEILWVIDEGVEVSKGDKLVQLESSSLEQQRVQQRIVCSTAQAKVIQSENTLSAAEISRIEYLEGAFRQQEQLILSEIFVAQENLRRAQLAFQSTERLAAKGIVTALQLEGDEFAVEKAKNELEAAKTKLEVLRRYTKEKTLKQFDSDIATAQAQSEADKESYNLEMEKLLDVELQLARCTIVLGQKATVTGEDANRKVEYVDDPEAPEQGQVVYANIYSSRGGSAEFVVEPGSSVRERQAIIRLPNAAEMQVKATVNESRISLVQPNLPAEVTLDALKDQVFPGSITKVNQYAEPGSWSSGNIKEYAAFINILNPSDEIRTGMNAEVRIFIRSLADVLQVPVQTLYETKGHFFCLIQRGDQFETREVQVGFSNDSFMTIESGLEVGEVLVMNPRGYPDKLQLPELPDEPAVEPGVGGDGENLAARESDGPPNGGEPVVDGVRGRGPGGNGPPGGSGPGDDMAGGGPGAGKPPGGFDPARVFAALDQDGDGVLTSSELQDVPADRRERMLEADADGDGSVTLDEFRARIGRGGGRPKGSPGENGP